ncbi:hypothetical protein Gorai_004546 [Gossypium raimondii]|uniref:RNase H type-1 domain-containing protein n=1 Tax=Gossypium raimondii TaxID=29730 RepID=A0A7J8QJH2_GOSRA|nr:hypothetical protein [Gossypium raimondii]
MYQFTLEMNSNTWKLLWKAKAPQTDFLDVMALLKRSSMSLEIVCSPGLFGLQLYQLISRNMFVFFESHSSVQEVVDTAPERGWVKLNTDGVVSTSTQPAAIGGDIHDDRGSWGSRQVELELDNALLVELMLVGNSIAGHIVELCAIHKILHRHWKVRIRHIPRAHNEVADFMAKQVPSFTSIQVSPSLLKL